MRSWHWPAHLRFEPGGGIPYKSGVPVFARSPIDAATRLCGVYGHPIRHSASPAFQNAALAALGLNWRYLAFEVHPDHLGQALEGARAMGFVGVNLTVPHKLLAVQLVDVLDESAKNWGAVNTIRFEARDRDGGWQPLGQFDGPLPGPIRSHGFNTDADAITRSLQEDLGLTLSGARVLLLGAGGAAQATALKLAADGVAELWLVNRTVAKAEALAAAVAARFPGTRCWVGYPEGTVDLVLNATSLGLNAADPPPLDLARFSWSRTRAAYDMIYQPAETPFLGAAREAGRQTANGIGMLLYQGAKALEIWTGRPAPVAVMREALLKHVYV
jgi:shikimate dehydrogenase